MHDTPRPELHIIGATVERRPGDHTIGDRRRILAGPMTWTAAQAAWLAGRDKLDGTGLVAGSLCVRADGDPHYTQELSARELAPAYNELRRTLREARVTHERKTIRAELRRILAETPTGRSFDQLAGQARRELGELGYPLERSELERHLKELVTIGRCKRDTWSGRGCERAYYWPRKEGPLRDNPCPHCGRALAQTSLALQTTFRRI